MTDTTVTTSTIAAATVGAPAAATAAADNLISKFKGVDLEEPSSCLKLLINAPTEEERLKAKSKGCYYSNMLTETTREGRLISRTIETTYWACFTGPYIALHSKPPDYNSTSLPPAVDYVVLSPQTIFETSRDPKDTTFTLTNIFLNRSVSMKAEGTRTFRCATEREVQEWRCVVQCVVEVLRGDFSLPIPPGVPSIPRVESIKHDAVRLSWVPNEDGQISSLPILHYLIQTKKERGDWSMPILVHSLTPYVVIRDLIPGTQYSFRICATNVLGEGNYSKPSPKVSTLRTPQIAPNVPSVVGKAIDAVSLEWEGATSGVKDYWGTLSSPVHSTEIRAYLTTDLSNAVASQTFDSTIGHCTGVVNGLEPGTTYVFKSCAVSYAGCGKFSKESKQCRTLGKPESGPEKIKILSYTHDSVELDWGPNVYTAGTDEATITGYSIGIFSESGEATVAVHDANQTSYTVSGLTSETAYKFRICAVNQVGSGPSCAFSKQYKTKGRLTTAPNSFAVKKLERKNSTGGTEVGVQLSWGKPHVGPNVASITGYKIFCQNVSEGGTAVELMVLGPEATELVKPLFLSENGYGTFNFYICAVNALGMGPQSNTSALELVAPPTIPLTDATTTEGTGSVVTAVAPPKLFSTHLHRRRSQESHSQSAS